MDQFQRLPVANGELARVLGGGIVPGSVVLVSGDPGIGKSTLLLQVSAQVAEDGGPVLYVSAEESVHQIKLRADRLGLKAAGLYLVSEVSLDQIVAHIDQLQPRLVVVDSIQAIASEDLASAAGSVSQVRACATVLLHRAKASGVPSCWWATSPRPGPSPGRGCWSTLSIPCFTWRAIVSTPTGCCAVSRTALVPPMRSACSR